MICKVCGISSEQERVEECNYLGYEICSHCCEGIGGGYLKVCWNCGFNEALQRPGGTPSP